MPLKTMYKNVNKIKLYSKFKSYKTASVCYPIVIDGCTAIANSVVAASRLFSIVLMLIDASFMLSILTHKRI